MKLAVLLLGLSFSAVLAAEDSTVEPLYESPKGTYRVQIVAGKDEPFIVSTRNPTEQAALPNAIAEDPAECSVRYYGSPDDNWILYTEHWRHHGVTAQELYHHESGVKFAPIRAKQWFAQTVRSYAMKNGGFTKTDFLSEGRNENHLDTKFRGWSFDSSRLLFGIYGDRSDGRQPFYVYFNARTKTLEQTPYLRELNKTVAKLAPNVPKQDVVCAEPVAPLPSETELKTRLGALDDKLSKSCAARMGALSKEDAEELREQQEDWMKLRGEGAKTYLKFAPKGEEERRRLQFMADAAAARIEEINQLTTGEL